MRRDANARVRPVVHEDVLRQQGPRDAIGMWDVERHRSSPVRSVTRRGDGVRARVGKLDQTRRLAHALFPDAFDASAADDSRTLDCREQRGDGGRSIEPSPSLRRVRHFGLEGEGMRVRLPAGERRGHPLAYRR